MKILNFLRSLRQSVSSYEPLIKVRLFPENILYNLHLFQKKYPQVKFAPVLKSNAYGHGLVLVARILDRENIAFLVVDSLFEAMVLRSEGVKSKILVIGFTRAKDIARSNLKETVFTVTSLGQLREIAKILKKKRKIHLKIDTGMHRQGILMDEIGKAEKIILSNKKIILEGVCSHLANADNQEQKFSLEQIKNWKEAVQKFKTKFPKVKYFHLSATGGTFYLERFEANVSRIGMGLYGIDPSPLRKMELKPTIKMVSLISGTKKIKKGESIGYGYTFKAEKDLKIATVPAGYYEGIDRRLSNKGFFKVKGIFCPILGRISMNITVIDVSKVPKVKIGEEVVLISENKNDLNSVEKISLLCETTPYEILVHLPQSLRRETKN